MREIKFRAWDKENKTMYYDGVILDMSNCSKHATKLNFRGPAPVLVELMQFTGLKDKNGKEIYEGDLCSFIVPKSIFAGQQKGMFMGEVKYDVDDAGYCLLSNQDVYPHVKFYFAKNIEVIGNVWEHPTLLT